MSNNDLLNKLQQQGYHQLRVMDDGAVVGLQYQLASYDLVIGLTLTGPERRYRYVSEATARCAALLLDGIDGEVLPGWVSRGKNNAQAFKKTAS